MRDKEIVLSKISELKKVIAARDLLGVIDSPPRVVHVWVEDLKYQKFILWLKENKVAYYVNGSSGDGIKGIHLRPKGRPLW